MSSSLGVVLIPMQRSIELLGYELVLGQSDGDRHANWRHYAAEHHVMIGSGL